LELGCLSPQYLNISTIKQQTIMKKSIFTLFSLAFLGLSNTYAQVGVGTNSPDASAALEVQSTTQGFLPPRMTEADRQDIITPAAGLIIYCTDCGSDGELQVYNGAAWTNLVGGVAAAGPAPTQSVINTFTQKEWMDRNLGASQVATLNNDAASYGDLYQWGRATDGHEKRNSSNYDTVLNDLSGVANFNNDIANPWYGQFITRSQGDNNWVDASINGVDDLWQGVNGVNQPCPLGYRLPSAAEWDEERLSWVESPISSNNGAAGAFESPLKLPLTGRRASSGIVGDGSFGFYWSSTLSLTGAQMLRIETSDAYNEQVIRYLGASVRCIKD
jgi:uncharacterized protein (TIGR02145 family)